MRSSDPSRHGLSPIGLGGATDERLRIIAACRDALARDIHDQAELARLGRTFLAQGRRAEAIAMLTALDDPDPETASLLVQALRDAGLGLEAEARSIPATSAAPDPRAEDLLRQGNDHLLAGRLADAGAAYREALALHPDYPAAAGNLGNVLTAQGDPAAAHDQYRAALRLDPNNADIGFAYSLSLLLAGDFAEGWRWHECRRRVAGLRWNYDRHAALPQWRDGMDLAGRRVLVMAEQGRGDMIQFTRFIPALARIAASVVLELPRDLHPVFEGTPGLTRLIDRDAAAADCDIACPLLSLPRALGLADDAFPAPIAAAREDHVAQWAAWIGAPDGRRRIGLVVSGDARHPHDVRRSIPLALLRPILSLPHRFVLVQTEMRDADRDTRDTRDTLDGLRFPGAALTDFGDTAGLLANLDLLISVDTAAAHLAGSLGVPTWLLLAHAPDHRWLLGREDSPWYPSMRLFRQAEPGGWAGVVERIRLALV